MKYGRKMKGKGIAGGALPSPSRENTDRVRRQHLEKRKTTSDPHGTRIEKTAVGGESGLPGKSPPVTRKAKEALKASSGNDPSSQSRKKEERSRFGKLAAKPLWKSPQKANRETTAS